MQIGRDTELECPRCRLVATRRVGRQERCSHCGARLVAAHGPSEEWIRAYLYAGDKARLRITRSEDADQLLQAPAKVGAEAVLR